MNMRTSSFAATLLAGFLSGIALIISCGDDSPTRADAAICDCPALEPKIAGRVTVVDATNVIGPNERGGQGTFCPDGGIRLSGSCTTETLNPLRNVTLEQSGFYSKTDLEGWHCEFKNNESIEVTVKVSVVCLMPAP
jgi:hypothetical protein